MNGSTGRNTHLIKKTGPDIAVPLDIDAKTAEPNSPLLHVTSDDAPTLLLAGVKDDLVPVAHSRNIQAAFEKAHVKSQLIEFKGAGHGFQGEDARKSTAEMVAWFMTAPCGRCAKVTKT